MRYKLITTSFEETVNILSKMTLEADEQLENMRVAYLFDDQIIHLDSAFDFIDVDPNKTSIKKISLYQLIN